MGEMNIFIFSDNPAKTFGDLKDVLESENMLESCTAAYRALSEEEYTVIWPTNQKRPFYIQ